MESIATPGNITLLGAVVTIVGYFFKYLKDKDLKIKEVELQKIESEKEVSTLRNKEIENLVLEYKNVVKEIHELSKIMYESVVKDTQIAAETRNLTNQNKDNYIKISNKIDNTNNKIDELIRVTEELRIHIYNCPHVKEKFKGGQNDF